STLFAELESCEGLRLKSSDSLGFDSAEAASEGCCFGDEGAVEAVTGSDSTCVLSLRSSRLLLRQDPVSDRAVVDRELASSGVRLSLPRRSRSNRSSPWRIILGSSYRLSRGLR